MNNEKLTMNNFLKRTRCRGVVLSIAALVLASCSVYDNYSEDSYNAFWGVAENDSISSSTTENLSSSVDEASSSSSKVPELAEGSSSSAVSFRCGLDSIADSEEYLGRKYATAKYGTQCWLAENSHRSLEGSKCYGDNEENCEIYGRLYSFEIAKFACPEGTHLPSEEEWITLQTTVSRNNGGLDLKSTETWSAKPGQSGGKFNAKAAGYYDAEEEEFVSLGNFAGFWSSTDVAGMMATYMYLSSSNQNFIDGYKKQSNFYSVRCLKD